MYPASHDDSSVNGFLSTTIRGELSCRRGSLLTHIRWMAIPTTVPHSGRESFEGTAPLCEDGAEAPRRTTATFPRITGPQCSLGKSGGLVSTHTSIFTT
jgi:hypothetical protein